MTAHGCAGIQSVNRDRARIRVSRPSARGLGACARRGAALSELRAKWLRGTDTVRDQPLTVSRRVVPPWWAVEAERKLGRAVVADGVQRISRVDDSAGHL